MSNLSRFAVSPVNQQKHVEWCQAHLHWTYDDWSRVIWTDESSFSTAGYHHRPWVIRKAGEEYLEDTVDTTYHSGRQSTMAWGAFCGTTKSDLIYVPEKAKLNSALYVDLIYEPVLIPFWHHCCELYGWARAVEDGAPGHKSQATIFRNTNGVDTIQWPSQSPDINLIEAVWQMMEDELGVHFGRGESVKIIQEQCRYVWEHLVTPEKLQKLIESMPSRLQAVIDANGGPTPY